MVTKLFIDICVSNERYEEMAITSGIKEDRLKTRIINAADSCSVLETADNIESF